MEMAPLLECCYCDLEWLRQGHGGLDLDRDLPDDERIVFVHPNLPTSTSEALGTDNRVRISMNIREVHEAADKRSLPVAAIRQSAVRIGTFGSLVRTCCLSVFLQRKR